MAQRVSRGIALHFLDRGTRIGVSGQQHAPAALYPRERPGTHFTGGWVIFHVWDILKDKVYRNNRHAQDHLKEGILYILCAVFSVLRGELECAMNNLLVRSVFIYP